MTSDPNRMLPGLRKAGMPGEGSQPFPGAGEGPAPAAHSPEARPPSRGPVGTPTFLT